MSIKRIYVMHLNYEKLGSNFGEYYEGIWAINLYSFNKEI